MSDKILEIQAQDPLALMQEWLEEAAKSEINDPDAVCLATATPDGKPSARMVLIKSVDEQGFKFHTNAESRKGKELSENPYAALCFHWKSLRKQVRVEGRVIETGPEESDEYFKTRPPERQIGAWASQQSRPLENREILEKKIRHYEKEFESKDIPRPDYWKGYRLQPTMIEFWTGNDARLHDRFVFNRNDDGSWSPPQRLYP